MPIGVDGGLLFDLVENLILQSFAGHIRNHLSADPAHIPLQHPHHHSLAPVSLDAVPEAHAPRAVHVLVLAADESLIDFDGSAVAVDLVAVNCL